jgi:hypothetical protein
MAPGPGALFVRALWATLRVRRVGREIPESLKAGGGQYIMAFWHGTLLLMVYAYIGERLTFLVSWHRDGELVTRIMQRFGMDPTRGSTSSGGTRALHSLLKKVKQGYDIAFTPDGPKGPARVAQEGIVQTARLAGLPVVPVGIAARRKRNLKSWDAFLVPLPFTRVVFAYGEPVRVPREATGGELEACKAAVQRGLEEATARAEAALGEEELWKV